MNIIIGIVKDEQGATIGYKVYLGREKRSMVVNTRMLASFIVDGRLPLVNAELDKAKHIVLYGAEVKYPYFNTDGEYIEGSAINYTILGIDDVGRYKVVSPWGVISKHTLEGMQAFLHTKCLTNAKLVPKGNTLSVVPLKGTFPRDNPPVEYKHLNIETPNAFGYCLRWRVQLVEPGQPYGLDYVLTNEGKTLVEFYDMVHNQFVSRYYADTILERNSGQGLNLQGDVHSWRIDGAYMEKITAWLKSVV